MENVQEKLNKAIDLINSEDFNQAQVLLNEVIQIDENNIEAYKNLGLCEVNLDNPPAAIEAFEAAVKLDKNDALSLFYLANCYSRTGEKEKAIDNFEKVITLRPDYLDAYKSLAMIYIEFSQVENAIEIAKKAIENESIEKDCSLYYVISTAYMLKKDYLNAMKNLELGLELNPEHLLIMNSLGVCYMNVGLYDKSEEVLQKAYEIDKTNSLTVYNLGIYFETTRNYKKALEFFQKSYAIEPSITMLATLANCALKAQEYSTAAALYQNLVMAFPNNSNYRLAYIEAQEAIRNYKEALDSVNQLLSLDDKNINLTKRKGALLRKMGFNIESIETFDILIKRGKIDVEIYYNLAFNYIELGDFDNAKEMFKKCITLEPNNPYVHKDLGVLYLKMNCYEWAIEEIEEAIKLENDVAEFHYSRGVALMMLSRIKDGIDAFITSLKLDNEQPDCLAYLGYAFLLEGDNEKALESLQAALQIAPDNFLAKNHMAKYYFQNKKYEPAKQFLLDIIEQTKDDETINMLGICCMETQEYEDACGLFSKLIPDYPKNHILLVNLAKSEYKTNKINEAKEHLRQALMIYDDYKEALDLLEEINSGK
ncbi:MAG: tetratricopeptide repeat protein [Candidatus Gastranaerophilales bacterium]|nr:tetratricopeptide repeat protein [Candidatus Gastranaerophilales bacterium]